MPISYDEQPPASEPNVRITGWVNEFPASRRSSEFDDVIDEVRKTGDPKKVAVVESSRGISGNRANYLRRRNPDLEIRQIGGKTYIRLKPTGDTPENPEDIPEEFREAPTPSEQYHIA
jgi:hypothetical protein